MNNLRLTLRTLLAYLDDILEPHQAKEIGQKIAEVRTAGNLIDRIQDVLRRRRLTAPDVHGGDGAPDANVVAEYLNDTLPTQQVAEYEKLCLEPDRTESDLYLAEVAACHQIWNSDGASIEVPESTRERLYAMIPQPGSPIVATKPPAQGADAAQAAPAEQSTAKRNNTSPAGKPLHSQPAHANNRAAQAAGATSARVAPAAAPLPKELRPKPTWQKALIPAAVLLVAIVWLGLIIFDASLWGDRDAERVADPDAGASVARTDTTDETPGPAIADNGPRTTPANGTATVRPRDNGDDTEPPGDAVAAGTADTDRPGGTGAGVGVVGPMPPDAGDADDGDAADGSRRAVAVAEASPMEDEPQSVTEVPVEPAVFYDQQDGVLLLHHPDEEHWSALPMRSAIRTGDLIATPDPFASTLQVDKDRLEVRLVGPARAEVLPPIADAALHLRLDFGAAIFTRPETTKQPGGVATVAVEVRGQTMRFDLPEPGAQVGVRVVPRLPTAPEQKLDEDDWVGMVRSRQKQTALRGVQGEPVELAEGEAVGLTPAKSNPAPPADQPQPGAAANGAAANGAAANGAAANGAAAVVTVRTEPLAQVPEWLELEGRPLTNSARRYVRLFADEFRLDEPVTPRMTALAKEPATSLRVAEYAVKCLGLVEAMPQLVDVLAMTANQEEIRQAAIAGLRSWLALNPQGGERLFAEVKTHFRDDTAEAVYRLLWGFSVADARDRDVSEDLVRWLDHEHIAVRELAFTHVKTLTGGRTYDYRPLDVPLQRAAAVERWEDHLRREGALVPK